MHREPSEPTPMTQEEIDAYHKEVQAAREKISHEIYTIEGKDLVEPEEPPAQLVAEFTRAVFEDDKARVVEMIKQIDNNARNWGVAHGRALERGDAETEEDQEWKGEEVIDLELKDMELQEAIFTALGAASMCWQHIDRAGIFDSTRARLIGEQLALRIFQEENEHDKIEGDEELWRGDIPVILGPGGAPTIGYAVGMLRNKRAELTVRMRRDAGKDLIGVLKNNWPAAIYFSMLPQEHRP